MTCPSVSSKPTSLTCNANNADRAPSSNVLEIKKQLNELCGTPLRSDASWGTEEIARLTRFQSAEGLPATGQADVETLERLARRVHEAEHAETETAAPLQFAASPTQTHAASAALLHNVEHAAIHGTLHGIEEAIEHAAEHGGEHKLGSSETLKKLGTATKVAGAAMTIASGGLRVLKAEDKTKETLKVVSGTVAEMTVGGPVATAATAACAPVIAFAAPVCGAVAYSVVGGAARFIAEGVVGGVYDVVNGEYAELVEPKARPNWNPQVSLMMNPAFNEGAASVRLPQ